MILQNVLRMVDPEHSSRVSVLARNFAQALSIPEREAMLIGMGAKYHDIGKISIPLSILQSPMPLTEEQQEVMKRHVEYGLSILSVYHSEEMNVAKTIIATHHERWDGTGYPNQLKGEDIPLVGRIVALCDVFDSLSSERPYKPAWTLGQVLDHIRQERGKAFDPELTDKFLEMICEGVLEGKAL
ncbi:HD-GYP domain-containing protein [Paenibacillus sp. WLX2291]|uniref:HD-GYP domain-containing protein n=1 Tax=Paenibacillus sp. WLX2291 TaxID=3296934 RepID=UPI003983FE44